MVKLLGNLRDILVRLGEISWCYHQIRTSPLDNSLRRTFVKRCGDHEWTEVAFQTASFRDIQARPVSSLAIHDCADRFMKQPARHKCQSNMYMDDLMLGAQQGENLDSIVQEVDACLK